MNIEFSHTLIAPQQVDRTRKLYAAHIAALGKAEDFATVGTKPEKGLEFAFIGRTEKRNSPSNYYRCSFCQTDRKFSAGNVVLSADGLLRLIGPECWKDHIDPERYQAQEADLRGYELRTRFAAYGGRIQQAVSDAIPRVRTLAYASASLLSHAERLPLAIASDTTGFGALLRRIRPAGGRLAVEQYLPDEAAGKDDKGRYLRHRPEQVFVHQVSGLGAAFALDLGLTQTARDAYQALRSAAEAIPQVPLAGDNVIAAKAIRSIHGQLGKATNNLRVLHDAMTMLQRFLSPANLRGIEHWSQHNDCVDELANAISFQRSELTINTGGPTLVLS